MKITSFRITISGEVGSGKTTIIKILEDALLHSELGIKYFHIAEVIKNEDESRKRNDRTEVYDIEVVKKEPKQGVNRILFGEQP